MTDDNTTVARRTKTKEEKIAVFNQYCAVGAKGFDARIEEIDQLQKALIKLTTIVASNKSKGIVEFTDAEGNKYPIEPSDMTEMQKVIKTKLNDLKPLFRAANRQPKVYHAPWTIFSNNPGMYIGDALTYFFYGAKPFEGPTNPPNFGLLNPHGKPGEPVNVPADYVELLGVSSVKNGPLLSFLKALEGRCASKSTILALYYRYSKVNERNLSNGEKKTTINLDPHMKTAFDLLPATFVTDETGKKSYQNFYTRWSGKTAKDVPEFFYIHPDPDYKGPDIKAVKDKDGKYYASFTDPSGAHQRIRMRTSLDVIVETRERNIAADKVKQAERGGESRKESVNKDHPKMTDIQSATQRNALTLKELNEFGWVEQLESLNRVIDNKSIEQDNIYVQVSKEYDAAPAV
jgi:hypothetical protein